MKKRFTAIFVFVYFAVKSVFDGVYRRIEVLLVGARVKFFAVQINKAVGMKNIPGFVMFGAFSNFKIYTGSPSPLFNTG